MLKNKRNHQLRIIIEESKGAAFDCSTNQFARVSLQELILIKGNAKFHNLFLRVRAIVGPAGIIFNEELLPVQLRYTRRGILAGRLTTLLNSNRAISQRESRSSA